MAIQWESEEERPHLELHDGLVRMYIDDEGDERWHSFTLTIGEFTPDSLGHCLKTWPREAILLARAELDRFEAQLGKGDE